MSNRIGLLLLAAGAVIASASSPAQAAILTQDTLPVTFSTNGSQTVGSPNTTPLTFQSFTAAAPNKLIDVSIKFVPGGTFGGNAFLFNGANATTTYTGTASPVFTFNGGGGIASGNPGAFTLTPNTSPALQNSSSVVGGTYASTSVALPVVSLQNYWAGLTGAGAPSIVSYYATWSISGDNAPSGGTVVPASPAIPASLTGQVFLTYSYQGPDAVPGPLPILGAGTAFGFSRKLRKRIRSSAA